MKIRGKNILKSYLKRCLKNGKKINKYLKFKICKNNKNYSKNKKNYKKN